MTRSSRSWGFWLQLGISGFRLDAVPFLIGRKGADVNEPQLDFDFLHDLRDFAQWRKNDAILLAEANVPPEENNQYFGEEGDRLQMMLNFPVNQRLWYALASGDLEPLKWAIEQTSKVPQQAQFVQFLRSHDECDLGRLTEEQRQKVFEVCGPDKSMQLYDRGIRRRVTPMLQGDRRRVELAFSLLLSLPRHAAAAVRRRDRDLGRPVAARTRVRADGDAVVERALRRLLDVDRRSWCRSSTTTITAIGGSTSPISAAIRIHC